MIFKNRLNNLTTSLQVINLCSALIKNEESWTLKAVMVALAVAKVSGTKWKVARCLLLPVRLAVSILAGNGAVSCDPGPSRSCFV